MTVVTCMTLGFGRCGQNGPAELAGPRGADGYVANQRYPSLGDLTPSSQTGDGPVEASLGSSPARSRLEGGQRRDSGVAGVPPFGPRVSECKSGATRFGQCSAAQWDN